MMSAFCGRRERSSSNFLVRLVHNHTNLIAAFIFGLFLPLLQAVFILSFGTARGIAFAVLAICAIVGVVKIRDDRRHQMSKYSRLQNENRRLRRQAHQAQPGRNKKQNVANVLRALLQRGYSRADAVEAQKRNSTTSGCIKWLNSSAALEGRLYRAGYRGVNVRIAMRRNVGYAACIAWLRRFAPYYGRGY